MSSKYSPALKFRVALASLKGSKTILESLTKRATGASKIEKQFNPSKVGQFKT